MRVAGGGGGAWGAWGATCASWGASAAEGCRGVGRAARGAGGACAGAVLLTTSVMAALEPCLPLWIMEKFHPQVRADILRPT